MPAGTFTGNASTDWVTLPEGQALISLSGTFRSTTTKLQMLAADGSTAIDITDGSWTAAVVTAVELGGGAKVRLTLSGSGSPIPDVDWEIQPMRTRGERPLGNPLNHRY